MWSSALLSPPLNSKLSVNAGSMYGSFIVLEAFLEGLSAERYETFDVAQLCTLSVIIKNDNFIHFIRYVPNSSILTLKVSAFRVGDFKQNF